MKTLLAALALLILQGAAIAGLDTDIPITQCAFLESDWSPSCGEAQNALRSIQSFLDHPNTTNQTTLRQIEYIRQLIPHLRVQFLGKESNGKNVILCNFFPMELPSGKFRFDDWQQKMVVVDDGYVFFWRIDYDPKTDACSNFQSSGFGTLDSGIPATNRVILKGDWTPTPAQTQKALRSIQSFFEKPHDVSEFALGEIDNIRFNTKNYRVQFKGIVYEGRKVIFCNFFDTTVPGDFKEWKEKLADASHGGYRYWHALYDPKTGKCLKFAPNTYG